MSQDVRARLIRGFAAQGFGQIVTLIIQIVSVPLFVHYWGITIYGEWILLSTIPAYFALSDLGFANAAGTEMTMRVARGDRPGALEVFQSAWVLVTGVTLALTVSVIGLAQQLPVPRWLHLSTLSHHEISAVITILVIQLFFDFQTGLLGLGYRADGHFAVGTMIRNMIRLAEFAAGMLALILGAGFIGVALATMLTRLGGNIFTALDCRRRSPWLVFGIRHASWITLRSLISPALSFMGFPLGNALSLQGIQIVVGVVLGPVAVVIFSTLRTLSRLIYQLMSAITHTVWVEMSTAFGAGDVALARRLHRRTCQAAVWLSVCLSVGLFASGHTIMQLWNHNEVPFEPVLFALLLLVVVCNSFWSASYVTLIAVNRHQTLAAIYAVATALSLGIALVLTHLLGLPGAALGLLVIDIYMCSYVVGKSLVLVEDAPGDFFRYVLQPPVADLMKLKARWPAREQKIFP